MPRLSACNIIGNLLFSGIVSDTVWMHLIGTALTAWVWAARHD